MRTDNEHYPNCAMKYNNCKLLPKCTVSIQFVKTFVSNFNILINAFLQILQ